MRFTLRLPILVLLVLTAGGAPAFAQATAEPRALAQSPDDVTAGTRRTEGRVVSVRRGSFTVRTEDGRYHIFALDRARPTARPLQPGMRVAVVTRESDEDEAPIVMAISIVPDEPGAPAPAVARDSDPTPPEVRAMETTVERQLRRYNAGIVGGVSVQPELIMVGGHVTFDRVFRRNVSVRPGLQLGFGELTTLLTLDLDVLYTIPGSTRRTRWAPYVGAGPTVGFRHRSLEDVDDNGNRFDFGDFDAEHGFNFIVGMRNPKGAFLEMKATASGVSDVRLLAGVTF